MKVAFFGTPDFVVPIPQALKEAGFDLVAVITNPDRPVGRNQNLTPTPVKVWGRQNKITVLTPQSLDLDFQAQISNLQPDVAVLAAYGKIIPLQLIKLFPKGILVVHPSFLPKYRGASPIQAALLANEDNIGCSIILMDEKVDHGPILDQFPLEVEKESLAEDLYRQAFQKSAEVLKTLLPDWVKGKIKPKQQDHSQATFTKTLKREDGYFDLNNPPSPKFLKQMIAAYHPWPGVWTKWQVTSGKQQIVKFLPENKIQVEGKLPVDAQDFLRNHPEAKPWFLRLFPFS